jgi:SAM domain (Sterile alpha motif)
MEVDVGAWLRGLGLGQYERAFRDNDIDAEVLSRLSADDLIAIGVSSVGHRRRLLDAIATLSGAPKPASKEAPVLEPVPEPVAQRAAEAERRQLTIMFVDLVGSTELSRAHPQARQRHPFGQPRARICEAVGICRQRLRSPPMTVDHYLDTLAAQRLPETVRGFGIGQFGCKL